MKLCFHNGFAGLRNVQFYYAKIGLLIGAPPNQARALHPQGYHNLSHIFCFMGPGRSFSSQASSFLPHSYNGDNGDVKNGVDTDDVV